MEIEKFLELTQELGKKKAKKEELERFKKVLRAISQLETVLTWIRKPLKRRRIHLIHVRAIARHPSIPGC